MYSGPISHKLVTSHHLVPLGRSISVIYNLHVWCVVPFHFHDDSFSAQVLSNKALHEDNTFNLKVSGRYYSAPDLYWTEEKLQKKNQKTPGVYLLHALPVSMWV